MADHGSVDTEQGTYIAPMIGDSADPANLSKSSDTREAPQGRKTAGVWGYVFQIIFQVIFLLKIQFPYLLYEFKLVSSQVSFLSSLAASIFYILFILLLWLRL